MTKDIKWLWSMWRARHIYFAKGTMFSRRLKFMDELRPIVGRNGARIGYPDAFFWVRPEDVSRAKSKMTEQ